MSGHIRASVKLSWALRTLLTTPNYAVSIRLHHSTPALEGRFNRSEHRINRPVTDKFPEEIKEIEHTVEKSAKPLQYLRECQTPEEIFNFIQEKNATLNAHRCASTLNVLYKMSKSGSIKEGNISQRKEFSLICNVLKKHIRELNSHDAITALKCLFHFKVPSSTYIVQLVLQMIRENINGLSIEQIIFLNYLLEKNNKTPLMQALQIALPIIFETHVNTKLNSDNVNSLIDCLQYCRKLNINNDVVQKIFRLIEKMHLTNLTPQNAKQILFCLIDWNTDENSAPLVTTMMEILAQDMENVDENELCALLLKLWKNYEKRHEGIREFYYHEGFMDACSSAVVSKNLGFPTAVSVLSFLNHFEHAAVPLLDYIVAKCFEDATLLQKATRYDISNIVSGLSSADYKPVFWDTIREALISRQFLDVPPMNLLKHALQLAALDCYCPEVLAKIFTSFEIRHDKFTATKKRLLLLHHTVKNSYPEYNGPWVSEEILQKCGNVPVSDKTQFAVKSAIECVLGGPQYVLTNLATKIGYYIDHVVIMRKGGFPIAINNQDDQLPTRIEDLKPLPDSQVLIFLVVPAYACPRNCDRLTGYWSLVVKQLELITKYTVIPIQIKRWTSMAEQDQVRYISQAIRLKSEEMSVLIN